MAVTRLKRKELRNRAKAKKRQQKIKGLTHMPPIKNIDIEKVKEEFAKKTGKKPAAKKEEAPAAKAAEKDQKEEVTTAVEKEPTKGSVKDAEAVKASKEKEPAKGSVEDAEAVKESKKEKGSAEDKE